MSFDIWLGCFKNGNPEAFPLSIVEEAFGRFTEHREPGHWILRYPDGGRGYLSVDDTPMVKGLAVNRAPTHPDFWQGILDVLSQTTSVLFWPGSGCVVASAAVVPDLPKDLIISVGAPTVVTRPEQILETIQSSD
jgi:hypothetical protein